MQLTAFGAQDRCDFSALLCGAPRRQLMRKPVGRQQPQAEAKKDAGVSGKRNESGSCPFMPAKVVWFDMGWSDAGDD